MLSLLVWKHQPKMIHQQPQHDFDVMQSGFPMPLFLLRLLWHLPTQCLRTGQDLLHEILIIFALGHVLVTSQLAESFQARIADTSTLIF